MDRLDYSQSDATSVRRRRRIGRPMREKTPDPNFKGNGHYRYLPGEDDEEEFVQSQLETTTASDDAGAQVIRMQIRAPSSSRSAHESKILRRRDKNFTGSVARSQSQPREAERLSSPEAHELVRTSRRSLSTPRHKDDEFSEADINTDSSFSKNAATDIYVDQCRSRLEQNLRRFEEERKRFEADKRQFERERREHKQRHKQMYDDEERRRLLQTYRKLGDRMQLPHDADERRRLVHSLRLQRSEAPTVLRRPPRHSACEESSTQFSSSEAEDANSARYFAKQLSPQRNNSGHIVASVRGPPPPPPIAPERRSVSRNNSLSPIRPQRRSRTPEQRADLMRRLNAENSGPDPGQKIPDLKTQTPIELVTNLQNDVVGKRKKSLDDALLQSQTRKASLELDSIAPISTDIQRNVSTEKETTLNVGAAESKKKEPVKTRFLERVFRYFHSKPKPSTINITSVASEIPDKTFSWRSFKMFCGEARIIWYCLKSDYPAEVDIIRQLRNKCICHIILLIMFCGFGALMFRYTEGNSEDKYKCEVRKVKRDFIENLWSVSHNMR